MAKDNAVWGIDIGQCALKALRCKLDSDRETVIADKYDYIEYPKILSNPEADPEELIQQALKQFLTRNEVAGDKVAVSVSGQSGLSRFFKPPPVEVKTLPDIVKYEVKQQIPFPIEDVIWDWQQLGGSVVDGRTVDAEVGLFAMKRDAVFRALHPFTAAEVEVDLVQLSPLSIFNVVCHDTLQDIPETDEIDPENPPPSVVMMSMGTDTTDLVVTNGAKLWLRNIPIGGNHFTRQLAREMKLTQAKAEHLKRNARQAENPKAIFMSMRPVFNDLVNEVQRSLTFFQSMEKNATISEIVLLGNAAKLPGLRQFLNKQLDINIAKFSEFQKLSGNDVLSQKTFSSNLLSYATCYGLCIQALDKGHININLLPREIVVERVIRAKKPWALAAVSLVMLGLSLGLFFKGLAWWGVHPDFTSENKTWRESMTQVSGVESKSKRFVTKDNELKDTQEKLNLIALELGSASDSKTSWLEIYSALQQAMPRDQKIAEILAAGGIALDPSNHPFNDREELYIDHIETVLHKDLGTWSASAKPIHDKMFEIDISDGGAVTQEPAAGNSNSGKAAKDEGGIEKQLTGQAGWVIEIKGHHFHNSDKSMQAYNSGKSYLLNTLIEKLLNKKDVMIPTPGTADQHFSYADLGILMPTITRTSDRQAKKIIYDPTRRNSELRARPRRSGEGKSEGRLMGGLGGMKGGNGGFNGAADKGKSQISDGNDEEKGVKSFDVYEYNFVVQLAWIPRTGKERLEFRKLRQEQEAADAKKKADQEAKGQAKADDDS